MFLLNRKTKITLILYLTRSLMLIPRHFTRLLNHKNLRFNEGQKSREPAANSIHNVFTEIFQAVCKCFD